MNYLEEIRERFSHDYYAVEATKITIENAEPVDSENPYECGAKNVLCSIAVEFIHQNANNGVMGGVYFTLADFAFAVAANGLNKNAATVTLNSTISFVGSFKGTKLVARPVCIKDGKSFSTYQIEICDESGNLVCVVLFCGKKNLAR